MCHKNISKLLFFLLICVSVCVESLKVETFTNPIIQDGLGFVEPFVHHNGDGIYYMATTLTRPETGIYVLRSESLTDWSGAERWLVFNMTDPLVRVHDPELHKIDCTWYIYFEGYIAPNGNSSTQKYYVIQGKDESPMGEYDQIPTQLNAIGDDLNAWDGTVLQHEDQLYFIWTGWPNATTKTSSLQIASMSSPMQIDSPRFLLREPTRSWEMGSVSEPEVLQRNGKTFILFTAGWQCLGIIGIDHGRHPLVIENWWQSPEGGQDGCIFWGNEAQSVYNINRASFTTTPGEKEWWVLYTAKSTPETTTSNSTIRLERFSWDDKSGLPVFPRPGGEKIRHKIPSKSF